MLAWHTQLKLSKEKDTQIRRQKLNRWTGTSHFLAEVVLPRTGSAWTEFAKEVEEILKGVYKKSLTYTKLHYARLVPCANGLSPFSLDG